MINKVTGFKVIEGKTIHQLSDTMFNQMVKDTKYPKSRSLVGQRKFELNVIKRGKLFNVSYEYVGTHTRVDLVCPKSGEPMKITPANFNAGCCCKSCGEEKRAKSIRKTQEQILKEFRVVHGDYYDYSKVEYRGSKIDVLIICPIHGEFLQTPEVHKRPNGCRKCGNDKLAIQFRHTAKQVIQAFEEIHGDFYDYSMVDYNGDKEYVTIICPIHGAFEQTPSNHKLGKGCNDCGVSRTTQQQTLSQEQVIQAFEEIHGDFYDYSMVDYINGHTVVTIICPVHGEFEQTPTNHKNGGCEQCGYAKTADQKRLTQEQVLQDFEKIHGDFYDYSKVEYIDCHTVVTIICPVHGVFEQTPTNHKSGGCEQCGIEKRSEENRHTLEQAIQGFKKTHGDFYDYSKVDYKGDHEYVIIVCPVHGEFLQTPGSHKAGNGCERCGAARVSEALTLSLEQVLQDFEEIHGDRYGYSKVEYLGGHTDVTIICLVHGEFRQTPSAHKQTQGCPNCTEYGYKTTLPGKLYFTVLEAFHKNTLIKIGITNYQPEKRMRDHSQDSEFSHSMLGYYDWDDGRIAKKVERILIDTFDGFQADHKFDGSTETFKPEDYKAMIRIADQFKEGRTMRNIENLDV